MDLFEYQGKSLFARVGVPVPEGRLATSPTFASTAANELGGRVVVKAQVQVGGRGRVGHMLSLVASCLKRGMEDGSIRSDIDPIPQAMQIWTSFLGVVLVGLNKESMAQRVPSPVDLEKLVPLHVDGVLRALKRGEAS